MRIRASRHCSRFEGNQGAEVALEQYADAPAVWEKPLEHALEQTGAASDEEVLAAARALMAETDLEGAARGKYTVNFGGGTVQGPVIGDHAKVTNRFGEPPV